MVAIDTRETNPEGGGMVAAGQYLWCVNDVTTTEDSVKVECVVVAGLTKNPAEESQAGRKQNEFLKIYGKGASRLLQWACAVGLLTHDEWKAAKAGGESVEFDETMAVGRYFGAGIELKPYGGDDEKHKGKEFPAMDFRIWPVTDPKMLDVIRLPESRQALGPIADKILAAAPKSEQKPGSNGGHAGSSAAKKPDAQPAAASAADPFGDF